MSAEPPGAYLIGQLCREFGVTARTLRYYEEIRLLAPIRDGRVRLYSKRDRARLILILRGRAVGMSLAEVAYLLDLYERGGRAAQQADALSSFRRQLRRLEARREAAEQGIAMLQSAIEKLSGEAGPGGEPSWSERPLQAESHEPDAPPAQHADVTSGRSKEDLVHGG